jgi:hypothetical protein
MHATPRPMSQLQFSSVDGLLGDDDASTRLVSELQFINIHSLTKDDDAIARRKIIKSHVMRYVHSASCHYFRKKKMKYTRTASQSRTQNKANMEFQESAEHSETQFQRLNSTHFLAAQVEREDFCCIPFN